MTYIFLLDLPGQCNMRLAGPGKIIKWFEVSLKDLPRGYQVQTGVQQDGVIVAEVLRNATSSFQQHK